MKAIYSKPLLAVEMFSYTQSVARDCVDNLPYGELTQNDPNGCAWDMGGGATVFIVGKNCIIDGNNTPISCYNNPGEGNYAFNS